ncbi:MAG: sulfite exporter TauE/SafE family protein [Bradyrhizobiaceae bacterium]|nr:sulfite exporter TauE/SafE family protein [Bradyrhizobiaceae bacterium]
MASVLLQFSLLQLALVAGAAVFASVVGGIAGYGTGLLLPLVLVPIIGPEPVVPVMAIAALLINASRVTAFRSAIEWRRTPIVLATAVPACVLGAWFYTRLSTAGTQLVIGAFLIASVPLRRFLKARDLRLGEGGLAAGGAGFGAITGTAPGTGVILISLLMASGLSGSAVIATDAAISVIVHLVQALVFGVAGAIDAQVAAIALLIGACSVPGAFLARNIVGRMPVRLHTAILDVVVLLGGAMMVAGALF